MATEYSVTGRDGYSYRMTTCCRCGVWFGMPEHLNDMRRADQGQFFCPNGHSMSYTESEATKLRRERDNAKQQLSRAEDERREAEARAERAEAAARRMKKRAAAGSCPCCKRTFSNMATHIRQKHPEFVCDAGGKVVPIKKAS